MKIKIINEAKKITVSFSKKLKAKNKQLTVTIKCGSCSNNNEACSNNCEACSK